MNLILFKVGKIFYVEKNEKLTWLQQHLHLSLWAESDQSLCTAGEGENTDTYEASPMRLLVGVLVVMVLLAAAIFTYIYVYNYPTSSASLFFMEVRQPKICQDFHNRLPWKNGTSSTA